MLPWGGTRASVCIAGGHQRCHGGARRRYRHRGQRYGWRRRRRHGLRRLLGGRFRHEACRGGGAILHRVLRDPVDMLDPSLQPPIRGSQHFLPASTSFQRAVWMPLPRVLEKSPPSWLDRWRRAQRLSRISPSACLPPRGLHLTVTQRWRTLEGGKGGGRQWPGAAGWKTDAVADPPAEEPQQESDNGSSTVSDPSIEIRRMD